MQKRKCRLALMVAILLMSPVVIFAQVSTESLVKKVQPATVLIITYDQHGRETGKGSGFFRRR